MDPPAPLRDRDPLDAVDAALELEAAPRPATLDEEDRVLDAPRTGRAGVHDLDFPALALRVLRVHAHKVLGEPRGRLAASACAGRDGLREDGGIGQRTGDLVRSLFDLTELVKQHRAQRLPQQNPGWSPPQPVAERSLRRHALPLVLPLEALDAPGRVHELLLAGV